MTAHSSATSRSRADRLMEFARAEGVLAIPGLQAFLIDTAIVLDNALSARSETAIKGGNDELRLSDGGIDQPLRSGEPAAWLVENPQGVVSVTLKNAQAPEFWIDGKIAEGYKVTPLVPAVVSAIAPITGEITGNRANTSKLDRESNEP